jgi:hypothetical protein
VPGRGFAYVVGPSLVHFLAGAESLGSGRRVQGREAIACDAEGALDAAAVTRTLVGRGIRLRVTTSEVVSH